MQTRFVNSRYIIVVFQHSTETNDDTTLPSGITNIDISSNARTTTTTGIINLRILSISLDVYWLSEIGYRFPYQCAETPTQSDRKQTMISFGA